MATELPPSSDFTGSAVTEGGFKAAITALRNYLSGLFGSTGEQATALLALGAILNSSLVKSGAYTIVASDRGKVVTCTGTFTLSLTDAATLGDGFAFCVWNAGSGTITIDPYLSQLIDGVTTITITAGKFAIIYCNGSAYARVGSIATGSGSGLDADMLDGNHASAFALSGHTHSYVGFDHGAESIGSFAIGTRSTTPFVAGQTFSASSIGLTTGTWRALQNGAFSTFNGEYFYHALFQRIS